jgi:hypothetical protein
MMTPLHPIAERKTRLAKYTSVTEFSEAALAELSKAVIAGIITIGEARQVMFGP